MPFKNAPTSEPQTLESLITCRPGQISSMSLLARTPAFPEGALCDTFMLLAFSEDESISEETYFSDMLYYLIEGSANITLHEPNVNETTTQRTVALKAGELFVVPAHTAHAVHAQGAIKLLQVSMK